MTGSGEDTILAPESFKQLDKNSVAALASLALFDGTGKYATGHTFVEV